MMTERVQKLRTQLRRQKLNGFIIPHSDEFQGEYIPASSERLAWISGFTGSAGLAILLEDKALLFIDGRYTLQARNEVNPEDFTFFNSTDFPPNYWIKENLPRDFRLGYDPWLHTADAVDILSQSCLQAGARLVPCHRNPLDQIWDDRPAAVLSSLSIHPEIYAGRNSLEKRTEIARILDDYHCQAAIITTPESLAWLLNIRGNDVPFSPIPLCYGIFYNDDKIDLFIDESRITQELKQHLGINVQIMSPAILPKIIDKMRGKNVLLDMRSAPSWFRDRLKKSGSIIHDKRDPCLLAKACKNEVELKGARASHHRDGIAMVRFLAWLTDRIKNEPISEISASEKLFSFRKQGKLFCQESFPTISAAGSHSAIVHYRANQKSNRLISQDEIYLVDSGGQYLDGTTDVTRTIAVSSIDNEIKRNFTLVLKGHIALANLRFPIGTRGDQIDALARHFLWQEGLDYDHGTGHGVGSYLSVHEGPQHISRKHSPQALLPGMILSIEPGYYQKDRYGIRIENLVIVRNAPSIGEIHLLEFEPLTLVPVDKNLILTELLDDTEKQWLNDYHRRVYNKLMPFLDKNTGEWLAMATKAIVTCIQVK